MQNNNNVPKTRQNPPCWKSFLLFLFLSWTWAVDLYAIIETFPPNLIYYVDGLILLMLLNIVADVWILNECKPILRMYFLLDMFLLTWVVSSASLLSIYVGIYEIDKYGDWRHYVYAVAMPLSKFLLCGSLRVCLKFFLESKLSIIAQKITMVGACLAYFSMGSYIVLNRPDGLPEEFL